MRYCQRKQGNVSDHQCKPLKHPECGKRRAANRPKRKRIGYCQEAEARVEQCGHAYCTELQGMSLHKMISGLWNADGHKLGRNPKSTRPPIGRMSDGNRNPEFRTNRITKAGTVDKRQNWKLYPTWNAYMEAGK